MGTESPAAHGQGPSASSRRDPGILLLTELFPPAIGGSPVLFEAIYSRVRATTVTVLADAWPGVPPPPHPTLRVIRRPILNRRWGVMDPKGVTGYLRVVREIRRTGVTGIVHCARGMPEGVAAWMNRRLGGAPYVCWSHGEDVVAAGQSRELSFLANRVFRGALANIVNSRNTGGMLEERGVPSSRIHVVHPGVDVNRFRPDVDGSQVRARYASPGDTLLLSVGRLQRRKGHDVAIEAVAQLASTLPVQYVIVGDGTERQALEALARRLGVGPRVHFVGETSDAELPAFYTACDVFVMPNRVDDGDIEGFGIVFLEAGASGRPAIGGRSGGVSEAIADGETGILVSGTDSTELAEAVRALALSPETRHAMGAAGRSRARDAFTWDRAGVQVDAVHRTVLSTLRTTRYGRVDG